MAATKTKKRPKMPKVDRWEVGQAAPWSDQVKFKKHLIVDAKGYNEWVQEVMPMVSRLKTNADPHKCSEISIGQCRLYRRLLPTHRWDTLYGEYAFLATASSFTWVRNGLQIVQGATRIGYVTFTDHVNVPILSRDRGGVWMSLAPNEIMTLRPGVRKASGKVLIAGLGMGWMARKVCEKKNVKSVTVVEIDPDIAAYFGDLLKSEFPKVKIVIGDAWEYLKRHASKFDSHLFDIWEGYGHSCDKFRDFQKKHPDAWAWGYYPCW